MKPKDYEHIVKIIRNFFVCHSLGWDDVESILRSSRKAKPKITERNKYTRIDAIGEKILKGTNFDQPVDMKAFRWFAKELVDVFEIDLPINTLFSLFTKIFRILNILLSLVIFVFILFIIVGGIFSNKSNFIFLNSPLITFIILIIFIAILSSLEGTQISITLLRMKDLESVRKDYERAYKVHKEFNNEEMTSKYLAGRQLMVILIVFLIAQITSFPNMNSLPFTEISFPNWMSPWFQIIFLKLGVLGAFLVLWTGQLLPQFLANRHPHRFLNLPFVSLIVRLAWHVEKIGLNKPWEWVSKLWKEADSIPISPKELYRQEVEEIKGIGSLGLKKEWIITKDTEKLYYQNSITVRKAGFGFILDESLEIKGNAKHAEFNYSLIRNGEVTEDGVYVSNSDTIDLGEGWRRIQNLIESKYGSFSVGDVIITENTTDFYTSDNGLSSDGIRIIIPTKFILFRILFKDHPQKLSDCILEVYNYDDTTGDSSLVREIKLTPIPKEDGQYLFEYVDSYPSKNSYYYFNWQVLY